MAITGAAELLATWEAGLAEAPTGRALLLHRTARPDVDAATLPVLPVGEREADLFALRRALFGERMQVRLGCAACGEDMEFDLDAGEFARSLGGRDGPGDSVVRVQQDGWDVQFRLPGAADLTAAARAADPRAALLARCLVSAVRAGAAVPAEDLPVPVQRRIAEAVEAADPGADVTLNIACPECGEATRAELDIASYLWTELDTWARDLLLDVHLLATSYGWSEPEIMALSPLRRRYYLELCADV
ncbi:T4 family baseplate hub assembly chaperone [Streptomyces sp. NPDC002285]